MSTIRRGRKGSPAGSGPHALVCALLGTFAWSTLAQCPPAVAPGAGFTGLRSGPGSTTGEGIVGATVWDPDGGGSQPPLLVAGTKSLVMSADHELHHLSAWDGQSWSPVGPVFVSNGTMKDMTVFQSRLIVLGWFATNDGSFELAEYDGAHWRLIGGQAISRADRTFATRDALFLSGREILIGTERFEIARWDGVSWSGFAADVWTAPTTVNAICEFDGQIYVGGERPATDPMPRATLTVTTGGTTSMVGGGLNGPVNHLIVFDGMLVVIGEFTEAGGMAVPGVAAWDGDQWRDLQSPVLGAHVRAFGVAGGALYVASSVWPGAPVSMHRFKDGEWTLSFVTSIGSSIVAIRHILEYNGVPVAAGGIVRLNGIFAGHAVTPRDGGWGALDPGTDSPINKVCRVGDELFVVGRVGQLRGVLVDRVALRGPSGWEPLAKLTDGTGEVRDAAEWRGQLVVAGDYGNEHNPLIESIAAWDGVAWNPVGSSFPYDRALAIEVDGNELYVGVRGGVGRFKNDEWMSISEPTESTNAFPIRALAMYNGELIAAGTFTNIGGVAANSIARWDGAQWRSIGSGVDGFIRSLAVFEGRLFAAGHFSLPEISDIGVAEWDGERWIAHQASSDTPRWMESVFPLGDRLIASGVFEEIGGKPISNLAAFDGHSWRPFAEVQDISVVRDGYLEGNSAMLVGDFPAIGGVKSAYIAELTLTCPADYVCDGVVNAVDLTSFLDDFAACELQPSPCGVANNADLNADTLVDILDLLDYLDAAAKPCGW